MLTSKEMLFDMRNLTLQGRADLYSEIVGKHITSGIIVAEYKRMGIVYARPEYKYRRPEGTDVAMDRRVEFVNTLARYIHEGRDIIYFDETTSNIWDKRTKVW